MLNRSSFAVLLGLPAFAIVPRLQAETILIGFSGARSTAALSASGCWNLVRNAAKGHRESLVDCMGKPTAVTLEITDGFLEGTGTYHDNGCSDATLPWLDEQVLKSLFSLSSANRTGQITLTGLDNASRYTVEVVASLPRRSPQPREQLTMRGERGSPFPC